MLRIKQLLVYDVTAYANAEILLKKRLDFFLILILFVPKFKKKFLFLQRNRERTDDMILKFPVIDFEKASVLKLYYKTFKI